VTTEHLQVSPQRLWASLQDYARLGVAPGGGIMRSVFSAADQQARHRLVEDCRALGLDVRVDAAANVVAVRPGSDPDLPAIMIGSHLDSVPNGGRYDGPLGVLAALEVLRTLQDRQVATRHAVALVSFTGEEATSFGTSTFGSRAVSGRLPAVGDNMLPDGRSVRQALADCGGDWSALPALAAAFRPPAYFLELHIEQGRRLEGAERALGVVSGVVGIYRQRIVFRGEAGHAGTTSMAERHDALRAGARLVLAVAALPGRVAAEDPAATATVGFLQVAPNTPNVIPGTVELSTDLRSARPELLAALAAGVEDAAQEAAVTEGLSSEVAIVLNQAPTQFDAGVRDAMGEAVRRLSGDGRELASQAGHDAVHMASLAPAGMLFLRCKGGLSHSPGESITPEDAALGAEALLQSLLILDGR
jgi:N-carbamoyl-L-amino-acid hydrolase